MPITLFGIAGTTLGALFTAFLGARIVIRNPARWPLWSLMFAFTALLSWFALNIWRVR